MEALDANPYLLKTLGYQPFEVRNCWSIVHEESLQQAFKEVGELAQGKKKHIRLRGQLRHKDGGYKWWYGQAQLVRKESKLGLLGVILISGLEPVSEAQLELMEIPSFPSNVSAADLA